MYASYLNDAPVLISVIIPVYNQEKFIRQCLDSILGQSYAAIEVIAVNDGSTDQSRQIIAGMAEKDLRIVLIDQDNHGEALARKRGYEQARGEYLIFVDHDDQLLPGAIESLYLAITRTGVDVVCGHALRKWGWKSRPLPCFPASLNGRVLPQKELFDDYYVSFFGINLFPVSFWGKIYRKSVVDQAMETVDLFTTPHLHFGGDEAFNLLLFPYLGSAYFIDNTVYVYRWGGLTSGFNPHLPELLDFSDFRIRLLDQHHYEKGYVPLFIEYGNILVSHVLQGLEYGVYDSSAARAWLQKEWENRYLVQRMRSYFTREIDIPDICRLVLEQDASGIIGLAEATMKRHRLRSLGKRLLRMISKR